MIKFTITKPEEVPEEFKCDPECTVLRCAEAHRKIAAALTEICIDCRGSGRSQIFAPWSVICEPCFGTGKRQIPGVERQKG